MSDKYLSDADNKLLSKLSKGSYVKPDPNGLIPAIDPAVDRRQNLMERAFKSAGYDLNAARGVFQHGAPVGKSKYTGAFLDTMGIGTETKYGDAIAKTPTGARRLSSSLMGSMLAGDLSGMGQSFADPLSSGSKIDFTKTGRTAGATAKEMNTYRENQAKEHEIVASKAEALLNRSREATKARSFFAPTMVHEDPAQVLIRALMADSPANSTFASGMNRRNRLFDQRGRTTRETTLDALNYGGSLFSMG